MVGPASQIDDYMYMGKDNDHPQACGIYYDERTDRPDGPGRGRLLSPNEPAPR